MELKSEMIFDLERMLVDKDHASYILKLYQDQYGVSEMICRLIGNGFFDSKEPFVLNLLRLFYAIQVFRRIRLANIRLKI